MVASSGALPVWHAMVREDLPCPYVYAHVCPCDPISTIPAMTAPGIVALRAYNRFVILTFQFQNERRCRPRLRHPPPTPPITLSSTGYTDSIQMQFPLAVKRCQGA